MGKKANLPNRGITTLWFRSRGSSIVRDMVKANKKVPGI
jgi:hypothetical protein